MRDDQFSRFVKKTHFSHFFNWWNTINCIKIGIYSDREYNSCWKILGNWANLRLCLLSLLITMLEVVFWVVIFLMLQFVIFSKSFIAGPDAVCRRCGPQWPSSCSWRSRTNTPPSARASWVTPWTPHGFGLSTSTPPVNWAWGSRDRTGSCAALQSFVSS